MLLKHDSYNESFRRGNMAQTHCPYSKRNWRGESLTKSQEKKWHFHEESTGEAQTPSWPSCWVPRLAHTTNFKTVLPESTSTTPRGGSHWRGQTRAPHPLCSPSGLCPGPRLMPPAQWGGRVRMSVSFRQPPVYTAFTLKNVELRVADRK